MRHYRQSKFNIKSMEGYGLFSDLDVALSNISDIYVYLDEEHRDILKKDLRKFYYEETNADSWQFSDALLYYKDMVEKMIQRQYDNQKSKDGGKRANMKYRRQSYRNMAYSEEGPSLAWLDKDTHFPYEW